LFEVSKSAADHIIDHLGPSLALQQCKRFRKGTVLIMDGTLVPTRDHTIAKRSKNYRYSTNHQVVIDADTRLVVAIGRPLPGNRNDCKAWELSGAKQPSARPPSSRTAATGALAWSSHTAARKARANSLPSLHARERVLDAGATFPVRGVVFLLPDLLGHPTRAKLCRRAMPSMAWWTPSPLRRQSRRIGAEVVRQPIGASRTGGSA
jgi:hypothetical protein